MTTTAQGNHGQITDLRLRIYLFMMGAAGVIAAGLAARAVLREHTANAAMYAAAAGVLIATLAVTVAWLFVTRRIIYAIRAYHTDLLIAGHRRKRPRGRAA